jgi:hypothetical protein
MYTHTIKGDLNMAIAKCSLCGAYNGYEEWPEEHREEYTPDKCFKCTLQEWETSKDGDVEDEIEETPVDPSEVPGEPTPTIEDCGEDNIQDAEGDDDEDEPDPED